MRVTPPTSPNAYRVDILTNKYDMPKRNIHVHTHTHTHIHTHTHTHIHTHTHTYIHTHMNKRI